MASYLPVRTSESQAMADNLKGEANSPPGALSSSSCCSPRRIALVVMIVIILVGGVVVALVSSSQGKGFVSDIYDGEAPKGSDDDIGSDPDAFDTDNIDLSPEAFEPEVVTSSEYESLNETFHNADSHPMFTNYSLPKRGVPLFDSWRDSRWKPDPNQLGRLYSRLGGLRGLKDCVAAEGTWQLRVALSPFGFGSNILNLISNSMNAYMHGKQFVIVSRRYKRENPDDRRPWSGNSLFMTEFEEMFTYPVLGETLCPFYNMSCSQGCRVVETSSIGYFRRTHHALFFDGRVQLARYFTRVTPEVRRRIDEQMPENVTGVTVAIHIRRGDKITEHEAEPTRPEEYVRVAMAALAKVSKVGTVLITTDSLIVAKEVVRNWKTALKNKVPTNGFILRAAGDRADNKVKVKTHASDGTIRMLSDLKVLVMADYFIGTQTSNFGVLACCLRGGNKCYNAEAATKHYHWDFFTEKTY